MTTLWLQWQAAIGSPLGLSVLWVLSAVWLLNWAWQQRQGGRSGADPSAGSVKQAWILTPEVRRQLPGWLRLLWFMKREVRVEAPQGNGQLHESRSTDRLVQQQRLERAGLPSELTVDYFDRQRRHWKMLCTLSCGALLAPLTQFLGWVAWPLIALLWTLAVCHPSMSLRAITRQRQDALAAQLPFVMELLVLGLESGHNLTGAWALVAHHAPAGQGRELAQRHMADLRSGLSRTESLRRLSQLHAEPGLRRVASTLIQSDALGGQLVPLLRRQSEQLLQAAAQRAEQQAVELPVRLLAPLLLCIFPCTFLILGWPIAHKLGQWL